MFYFRVVLFSMIAVAIFIAPTLIFNILFGFVALVLSLATLITVIGPWNLYFELLSNFHPQLLIVCIFFLIVSFIAGYFRFAIIFAVCAFVHAYAFKDFIEIPPNNLIKNQAGETSFVRVLTLNMQGSQADIEKLKDRIDDEKPTVIALTELPQDNTPLMDGLKSEYPYTVGGGDSPYNVVLLSKWPVQNSRIERIKTNFEEKPTSFPILTADICTPENKQRCMTFVALDTPNTLYKREYRTQQTILRKTSDIVLDAEKNPVIVVGRLNTTPWTSTFQTFTRNAQLHNSAIGFMWQTTWLYRSTLFGLHFDHILVSKDVAVRQWWVAASVGSDHYPVFADLIVKWTPSGSQEPAINVSKTPAAVAPSSP
jgi:endonuclease/exonuclease/phosphatase (EEP) superfamily protein YafD